MKTLLLPTSITLSDNVQILVLVLGEAHVKGVQCLQGCNGLAEPRARTSTYTRIIIITSFQTNLKPKVLQLPRGPDLGRVVPRASAVAVAKAHAWRVLEEEEMANLIPAVGVSVESWNRVVQLRRVFGEKERTELGEHSITDRRGALGEMTVQVHM